MIPSINIYSLDQFGTRTHRMTGSRLLTALHLAKSFSTAEQYLYLITVQTATKSGSIFLFSNGTTRAFGSFSAESFSEWAQWVQVSKRIEARQSKKLPEQRTTLVRRSSGAMFAI